MKDNDNEKIMTIVAPPTVSGVCTSDANLSRNHVGVAGDPQLGIIVINEFDLDGFSQLPPSTGAIKFLCTTHKDVFCDGDAWVAVGNKWYQWNEKNKHLILSGNIVARRTNKDISKLNEDFKSIVESTDAKSFVYEIITHGTNQGVLATTDGLLDYNHDICRPFNNKNWKYPSSLLKNKDSSNRFFKLIALVACRHDNIDIVSLTTKHYPKVLRRMTQKNAQNKQKQHNTKHTDIRLHLDTNEDTLVLHFTGRGDKLVSSKSKSLPAESIAIALRALYDTSNIVVLNLKQLFDRIGTTHNIAFYKGYLPFAHTVELESSVLKQYCWILKRSRDVIAQQSIFNLTSDDPRSLALDKLLDLSNRTRVERTIESAVISALMEKRYSSKQKEVVYDRLRHCKNRRDLLKALIENEKIDLSYYQSLYTIITYKTSLNEIGKALTILQKPFMECGLKCLLTVEDYRSVWQTISSVSFKIETRLPEHEFVFFCFFRPLLHFFSMFSQCMIYF